MPTFEFSRLTMIVKEKKLYFHGIGVNGFPSEPPNYIGFRYDGRLQSIHYIEKYEVFQNPHDLFPEIPDSDWDDRQFLYHLGTPIVPNKIVKTGNIYRNGRVWCMLDTLLTSNTISESRDTTKKRREENK